MKVFWAMVSGVSLGTALEVISDKPYVGMLVIVGVMTFLASVEAIIKDRSK